MPTDKQHHRYSPSSAHRWMRCALAPVLEARIQEPEEALPYAAEGTAVHAVAEQCAKNRTLAWDFLDTEVEGVKITEEMVTSINDYVTMLNALEDEISGIRCIEQPVEYGDAVGLPGAYGTPDCYIVSETGKSITVVDRKFKWGKRVSAERNAQLMLYAVGIRDEVSALYGVVPEIYKFVIHQHLEEAASSWECGNDELNALVGEVKESISICEEAEVRYSKGEDVSEYGFPTPEGCFYCKAKAHCPVLAEEVKDIMEELPTEQVAETELEELAYYRSLVPLVELWASAITNRVAAELHAGNKVPGWKLVLGKKGDRKWLDEDATIKQLKSWRLKNEEIYKHELRSPTQIEKVIKNDKKRFDVFCGLVTRSDPKPIVVPTSDPRDAISADVDNDFENLDSEEI